LQDHILSTSEVALKRKTKYLKHSLPSPYPNAYLLESSQWLNIESLQPSKVQMLENCCGPVSTKQNARPVQSHFHLSLALQIDYSLTGHPTYSTFAEKL
jgi:hypothetical protein